MSNPFPEPPAQSGLVYRFSGGCQSREMSMVPLVELRMSMSWSDHWRPVTVPPAFQARTVT